jgi:hypothetical protein
MRIALGWARGITIATSWRMLRDLGAVTVLTGLIAGCASLSSPAPPTPPQAECERNNGAWRAVLNFCEHGR